MIVCGMPRRTYVIVATLESSTGSDIVDTDQERTLCWGSHAETQARPALALASCSKSREHLGIVLKFVDPSTTLADRRHSLTIIINDLPVRSSFESSRLKDVLALPVEAPRAIYN